MSMDAKQFMDERLREQTLSLKLLTARQVAGLLGVHVSTVWRLIQRVENPLKCVHFCERITRFRLADVERFIVNSADRPS